MTKFVVLYWEPGSCGDFVQQCLLYNKQYHGIIDNFVKDSVGRIRPGNINQYFKDNFKVENNLWYEIDWNSNNVEKLFRYVQDQNIKEFVIPTHKYMQVVNLKHQIPEILSVGMVYPENMFPLVIKNWCKKVTANDQVLQQIYNEPLHKTLIQNKVFGEYILSEQLKFGSNIPFSVFEQFDVNISLESLFNKDIQPIKSLLVNSEHVDSLFNGWFTHQSEFYKYQQTLPPELAQSLGYNRLATETTDRDIDLDIFDNILINHYSGSKKQLPIFKKLSEAQNFFKEPLVA